MIIAELSCITFSDEAIDWKKQAVLVLAASGLKYEEGELSICFEAETLEDIMGVYYNVHSLLVEKGVKRIVLNVKVDDRRDKDNTMHGKKTSAGA